MNLRQKPVWMGLSVWLLLFTPLLVFWSLRPMVWAGHENRAEIGEVRKLFPLHLARYEPSALRGHLDQITEDEPEIISEFSAVDWAWREMRLRLVVSFFFWTTGGLIFHWVARQMSPGLVVVDRGWEERLAEGE